MPNENHKKPQGHHRRGTGRPQHAAAGHQPPDTEAGGRRGHPLRPGRRRDGAPARTRRQGCADRGHPRVFGDAQPDPQVFGHHHSRIHRRPDDPDSRATLCGAERQAHRGGLAQHGLGQLRRGGLHQPPAGHPLLGQAHAPDENRAGDGDLRLRHAAGGARAGRRGRHPAALFHLLLPWVFTGRSPPTPKAFSS